MSRYTLTILDTSGIQSYIFNSNRLRENIGASHLVNQATKGWVIEQLKSIGVSEDQQQKPIETTQKKAELIYASGGNALIVFDTIETARVFTSKLTRQILEEAPGINLVVAHQEFDWKKDELSEVVRDLMENELEKQKRSRLPSSPLLGLSVTAACQSTQLVAVASSDKYLTQEDGEQPRLISGETEAKLKNGSEANQDLREKFRKILGNFDFPYRGRDLGRSREESSYYAVVHADGNSMGERFEKYGEIGMETNLDNPNRGYIEAMRKFSHSVDRAGINAIKKVIETLKNSIDDNKRVKDRFEIKDNYLPIRPLVYGGDDVTFICDGRLGLELAALYLKTLAEQKVADGKRLTACAGVCIVKSHYPFARAYALSENLCSNAKKFLREPENYGKNYSAIDWHIASSGLFGSLGDIREREYKVPIPESEQFRDLTVRPLLIDDVKDKWRTWGNFRSIVDTFNDKEPWQGRRNKIIALREKLRSGPEATKQFLKAYGIDSLPKIPQSEIDTDRLYSEGYAEERCGYFDAIEAMDFYFPLNGGVGSDSIHTEDETAK